MTPTGLADGFGRGRRPTVRVRTDSPRDGTLGPRLRGHADSAWGARRRPAVDGRSPAEETARSGRCAAVARSSRTAPEEGRVVQASRGALRSGERGTACSYGREHLTWCLHSRGVRRFCDGHGLQHRTRCLHSREFRQMNGGPTENTWSGVGIPVVCAALAARTWENAEDRVAIPMGSHRRRGGYGVEHRGRCWHSRDPPRRSWRGPRTTGPRGPSFPWRRGCVE
jgi:hypothetical protein